MQIAEWEAQHDLHFPHPKLDSMTIEDTPGSLDKSIAPSEDAPASATCS